MTRASDWLPTLADTDGSTRFAAPGVALAVGRTVGYAVWVEFRVDGVADGACWDDSAKDNPLVDESLGGAAFSEAPLALARCWFPVSATVVAVAAKATTAIPAVAAMSVILLLR